MNKHLYLCHLLVLSSPTLMMHGHTNLKLIWKLSTGVCKFPKSDSYLRHVLPYVRLSEWTKLATIGRIFVQFVILGYLKNICEHFLFFVYWNVYFQYGGQK